MMLRPFWHWVALVGWLAADLASGEDLPGNIRLSAMVSPIGAFPGDTVELTVTIQIPPGWQVYDVEQTPGTVLPTKFELEPMDGLAATETFRSDEALEAPEPRFGDRMVRYFDRSPQFRRPLFVNAEARSGERVVRGRATFLALDRSSNRFFVVNDAPFQATMAILDPHDSATDVKEAATPGITFPDPKDPAQFASSEPASAPPIFSIQVDAPSIPPAPEQRATTFLSPWMLGILLVLVGVGWASVLAPAQHFRLSTNDG